MTNIASLISSNNKFKTFEEFINVSEKLTDEEWNTFREICSYAINFEWQKYDVVLGCKIAHTNLKDKFNLPDESSAIITRIASQNWRKYQNMKLFNWRKKEKKQNLKTNKNEPLDEFTQDMYDAAEKCVKNFEGRFDGLDFTEQSLKVIDNILDELSDFYPEMEEDQQNGIINLIGSYVFEVARRNFGGKYFWHDQRNQPILVTGQPEFEISIIVFDKIKGRIINGQEDNISYFFEGYSERVRNAKNGDSATIV